MASEETPLLAHDIPREAVYTRFDRYQKRRIVGIVAGCGLLAMFIGVSFVTTIPAIAKDLNSTIAIISLAVSFSTLSTSVGGLVWATYSSYYGRKPIYLFSLICFILGSLAVSMARSARTILIARVVQGFGMASGNTLGLAVIGDIYKLEERGMATGVFNACVVLGVAFSPIIGGFVTEYYGWRALQSGTCVAGLLMLVLVFISMPETIHPGTRGVDKPESKKGLVALNPFECLRLLKSPNVSLIATAAGLIFGLAYALVVPISKTLGRKYNIENAATIGALITPIALGNVVGGPISGKISDLIVVRWRKHRGGIWVPEDRLRGTFVGGLFLAPLSVAAVGLTVAYVDGTAGVVLSMVLFFLNGVGVDVVIAPLSVYLVDILHSRSAEVSAVNIAVRGAIIAITAGTIVPLIETFGVLKVYAFMACTGWLGFFLIWSVIRWGDKMRAYADVGFSTAQTN